MTTQLKEGEYCGTALQSWEHPGFRANLFRYETGLQIGQHVHENSYISLLLGGAYAETARGTSEMINAGQVLFRPAQYVHANHFASGGTCFNIEWNSATDLFGDADFRLPQELRILEAGALPFVYQLLIAFRDGHSPAYQQEILLDGFAAFGRDLPVKTSLPWLHKVLQILENELDVAHSPASLAERVFVHPVYLARAFKNKTGNTVGAHQLRLRLAKAVQLLLQTPQPVTAIALATGFYDTAHFIRSFRRVYRIPPQQFRAALKG